MGTVYLAEQTSPRRKVVLKLLRPDLSRDEAFRQRFVHESEAAASTEHPNIVPIYSAGEADGVLYIAMRYVEGDDLRRADREPGPAAAGSRDRDRVAGRGRARCRARSRSGAPGREAEQHPARQGRQRLPVGLRTDQAERGRHGPDQDRPVHGVDRVLRARTDPRGRGRRPGRRVLARVRAVRSGRGPAALHARHRGRDVVRASRAGAAPRSRRSRPARARISTPWSRRRWPRTRLGATRRPASSRATLGMRPASRAANARPRSPIGTGAGGSCLDARGAVAVAVHRRGRGVVVAVRRATDGAAAGSRDDRVATRRRASSIPRRVEVEQSIEGFTYRRIRRRRSAISPRGRAGSGSAPSDWSTPGSRHRDGPRNRSHRVLRRRTSSSDSGPSGWPPATRSSASIPRPTSCFEPIHLEDPQGIADASRDRGGGGSGLGDDRRSLVPGSIRATDV